MSLILDLLFPKYCVGCKKIGTYLCPNCEKKIEYLLVQNCPICSKPSFDGSTHPRCKTKYTIDGVTSITRYSGPIKPAIRQIKYRLVKDLVKTFATLILLHLPQNFPKFDLIIPIPLSKKRLQERGFNQAAIFGKYLSQSLNIPQSENILIRTKATKPQFSLPSAQRILNIKGAFTCQNPNLFEDKKVLLIDDVATTYSTLVESANILKRNKASFVWALTLAHGK